MIEYFNGIFFLIVAHVREDNSKKKDGLIRLSFSFCLKWLIMKN